MRPLAPARATLSGPTPSEPLADASHARPLQISTAGATAPVRLPEQPGEVVWLTLRGDRGATGAHSLRQTADGQIWIGTIDSLYELDRAPIVFPPPHGRRRPDRHQHLGPRRRRRRQSVGRDHRGRRDEADAQRLPLLRHPRRTRRSAHLQPRRGSLGRDRRGLRRLDDQPLRRPALHARAGAPAARGRVCVELAAGVPRYHRSVVDHDEQAPRAPAARVGRRARGARDGAPGQVRVAHVRRPSR